MKFACGIASNVNYPALRQAFGGLGGLGRRDDRGYVVERELQFMSTDTHHSLLGLFFDAARKKWTRE